MPRGRDIHIGDFARMTHLTVKALRHYHEVGLLVPAHIDAATSYRYYRHDQIAAAHLIKRLRDLGMPVDEVRALLEAHEPAARNALIAAHLERLDRELAATRSAVAALRALVERPEPAIAIEYRTVPMTDVVAISEHVARADLSRWWADAFDELHAVVDRPTGTPGALFATELFADEAGVVTAFIPARRATSSRRAAPMSMPAVDLAIATHAGPHDDIDRTYGALGAHVTERELGLTGAVREHYVVDRFQTRDASAWRTEIGWPILRL